VDKEASALVRAASQAARSGNLRQAEKLWEKVIDVEPAHAQALCSLGVHALHRGDTATALQHLAKARQASPSDYLVLMTLAAACRQDGNADGEREAIDSALDVDPHFVPALLAKADWMERFGTTAAAAATYQNALKISPAEQDWPADFRPRLQYASDYVKRYTLALHEHLQSRLASNIGALSPGLAERWREAASIRAGLSQPYASIANQLHIPRLPAIPFFERSHFPFLDTLEAKTDVIRAELEAALGSDREQFKPYIAYQPGDPVAQWSELNHSDRWSAYHLWRNGRPVTKNLERCPETARALEAIALADIDGLCPNVFFSALQPHTHIPPHNGESNARLIAHLPLIVPQGCRFRVGFEQREWEVGKVMIFDDTLEHEAVNDSDALRVVLIFDLWNPLLSVEERDLTSRLAIATREFGAARSA
jgi:aspartyl/asparaginyl beta-hydroxylase (cupin superfamily)